MIKHRLQACRLKRKKEAPNMSYLNKKNKSWWVIIITNFTENKQLNITVFSWANTV